jgi:hypothetical protein
MKETLSIDGQSISQGKGHAFTGMVKAELSRKPRQQDEENEF